MYFPNVAKNLKQIWIGNFLVLNHDFMFETKEAWTVEAYIFYSTALVILISAILVRFSIILYSDYRPISYLYIDPHRTSIFMRDRAFRPNPEGQIQYYIKAEYSNI